MRAVSADQFERYNIEYADRQRISDAILELAGTSPHFDHEAFAFIALLVRTGLGQVALKGRDDERENAEAE